MKCFWKCGAWKRIVKRSYRTENDKWTKCYASSNSCRPLRLHQMLSRAFQIKMHLKSVLWQCLCMCAVHHVLDIWISYKIWFIHANMRWANELNRIRKTDFAIEMNNNLPWEIQFDIFINIMTVAFNKSFQSNNIKFYFFFFGFFPVWSVVKRIQILQMLSSSMKCLWQLDHFRKKNEIFCTFMATTTVEWSIKHYKMCELWSITTDKWYVTV